MDAEKFNGGGRTRKRGGLMVEFVKNAIKDLDVSIEKRNDGAYIVVADKFKHLARGKNVLTYWPTSKSVAVIILGLLPKKTYHSVREMEQDRVAEKL